MNRHKGFIARRKETHRTPPGAKYDLLDKMGYLNAKELITTGYADSWWTCIELGYYIERE